jgi:hypothetical protein
MITSIQCSESSQQAGQFGPTDVCRKQLSSSYSQNPGPTLIHLETQRLMVFFTPLAPLILAYIGDLSLCYNLEAFLLFNSVPCSWRYADESRILAHQLHTKILDPNRLVPLLRTARHIMFPTNTFPRHKQPPPTADEVVEIRVKCASTIMGTIPVAARRVYFGTAQPEEQLAIVDGWLCTLEDSYLNKHAVFRLVESLAVRVLPELAEKDVSKLFEEKMASTL